MNTTGREFSVTLTRENRVTLDTDEKTSAYRNTTSSSPSPSSGSSRAEIWTASWLAGPPLNSTNPLSPYDNTSSHF